MTERKYNNDRYKDAKMYTIIFKIEREWDSTDYNF